MASVSYRRMTTKKGTRTEPKLVIGIPQAACKDFKPKAGETFGLYVGSGADSGKAQIKRAPGGAKVRVVKGSATLHFGHVPKLGTDAAEKEFVAVKPITGGVEITLPAWFVAEA